MARKKTRNKKQWMNSKRDTFDDEFKGKACKSDKESNNAQMSAPNDWKWYAQNEQLLIDSASFSYNNPLGNQLNWGAAAGDNANGTSVPGIFAVYTSPSFGVSTHENAPINIAARNIYSAIRHANSGAANYDSPDLMLYLIAMDSCYSYLAFLKRVYGVVLTQSFTNRYYPKAVVNAMGVDYDNVQQNLANFRYFINSYATKLGNLCIPATMSYMARHMWMYSGYYVDSEFNDKAQTYLYTPELFYRFTLDQDKAGCLVPYYFTPTTAHSVNVDSTQLRTVSFLAAYGNALLDPILSSQDCGIMSGDILKAYGPTGVFLVDGIPENYVVLPTYNPEVLSQISNATFIGRTIDNVYDITDSIQPQNLNPKQLNVNCLMQNPEKQYLIYQPLTEIVVYDEDLAELNLTKPNAYRQVYSSNKMINFQSGGITPAQTMVASRLTNTAAVTGINEPEDGSYSDVVPQQIAGLNAQYSIAKTFELESVTVASDYAGFAKIFYYSMDNRGTGSNWNLYSTEDIYTVLQTYVPGTQTAQEVAQKNADDFRRVALVSAFDWHPPIMLTQFYNSGDSSNPVIVGMPFTNYLYDINYYTILSEYNLQNMGQTALLSQFNTIQYGKVSTEAFAR